MSQLSYDEFVLELRDAIAKRTPWAFMRFGDGEGIILGYPQLTKEHEYLKRLDKWFGSKTMNGQERALFADNMKRAAVSANVLGVPGPRHKAVNKFWDRVVPLLQSYGALGGDRKEICMDVVIDMHVQHGWKKILDGLPWLGLITCRLLEVQLRSTFHITKVESFYLPPQNKPYMGGNYSPGPHYPDRYRALPNWLDTTCKPGSVYLVGAGGLGKLYCQWIKERGGIAIDAGSILDGWAGFQTRSYLRARSYAL